MLNTREPVDLLHLADGKAANKQNLSQGRAGARGSSSGVWVWGVCATAVAAAQFDPCPVDTSGPKPCPGQRGWVFITFK